MFFEYDDGSGSNFFLARDPEHGAELLRSKKLEDTVTSTKVSDCYVA